MNDPINRPHFATGIELDGPYRRTPAQHAQRMRVRVANALAKVLASVKAAVQKRTKGTRS